MVGQRYGHGRATPPVAPAARDRSTPGALERLDRKLARRLEVVGIFGDMQAVLQPVETLLEERQDE